MSEGKLVILSKTHYKIGVAATILQSSYTAFYQFVNRSGTFVVVNGIKFLTAEQVQSLFCKYRPFDNCSINFAAPEVY